MTLLYILATVYGFGIVLVVARAIVKTTIFDRVLMTNVVGTLVVLVMVILALAMQRPDFVDLAMLYALLNFIGVIATLKYIRFGNLGNSSTPTSPSKDSQNADLFIDPLHSSEPVETTAATDQKEP
jgi:multicomponent Na+:H+ antiporter subunit F